MRISNSGTSSAVTVSKMLMEGINCYTPVDPKLLAKAPEFVFHHVGETMEPVRLLTSFVTTGV
jgi:hypothetical protein